MEGVTEFSTRSDWQCTPASMATVTLPRAGEHLQDAGQGGLALLLRGSQHSDQPRLAFAAVAAEALARANQLEVARHGPRRLPRADAHRLTAKAMLLDQDGHTSPQEGVQDSSATTPVRSFIAAHRACEHSHAEESPAEPPADMRPC